MGAVVRSSVASVVFILILVFASTASAQTVPWREPLDATPERVMITVGEHEIDVQVAVTGRQQSLGLGYRNGLEEGTGMLFANPDAQPRSFWMKGMRFCLDIIWIEQGEIIGAAESVCPDPEGMADVDRPRYRSGDPVTYVLEVPAGWLEQNGYGPGTPVQIPDEVQDLVDS